MKRYLIVFFWLFLVVPNIASAETVYTRYFESIDGDLRSDILQVYSVTALRGEKITLVVYGLEEGMAPAISVLDPTGVTLVEDLNSSFEDVSLVQFDATVDGIYPFVVYRQTDVEGLVRIMVFEGDPLDATTSLLDTIDPLLPSRAYLLAGARPEDADDFAGQPIEFSIQSLPFENVSGVEDEELPQPQFFASRATRQDVPEIEERLTAVEHSDWLNNPNIQLYTLNIRPVPENQDAVQQEVFTEGTVEIPTLEQPLIPYDIVLTVKPGLETPIRLERPFCTGSLPLVGRTLTVQNIPGEAYTPIGTLSGGDVVEIIGTDETGNYVQIAWDAALSGSGWVQYQEIFEIGSPECVRVVPVEEDMERLDQAIEATIEEIRERVAPQEVAEVVTPVTTPRPTVAVTPAPVVLDVQLTNAVDNPNPTEGSTITFTIALGNFSNTLIEDAQVNILLPLGLTYAGNSEQCLEGSVFPICILDDIPAGEVRGFLLFATVDPNTLGQTLTTVAETNSSGVLLQARQDITVVEYQAPIQPTLTPTVVPSADLSLSKIVDDTTPRELDSVTYTLTATNNGPEISPDVTVSDLIPATVSFISSTPSQGTYDAGSGIWTIGELDVGASATLTIQGTVNTGTYSTTITNTATITATSTVDPIPANNTASVAVLVDCTPGDIVVAASDTAGLINAINTANGNVDATTICLTNSTYMVTAINNSNNGDNGLPAISTPITILGANATVTRSSASDFRIFYVDIGGNLDLQNITLSGGNAVGGSPNGRGGAIYNFQGTFTLTNTTISGNAAATGGVVDMTAGTMSIYSSFITANTGVAINGQPGNITIDSSTITGNSDSGLRSGGGTTTIITNSTFSGNNATDTGGGIQVGAGSNVTVTSSTVSNNTAVNYGGGIAVGGTGVLTLNGTTISGNSATYGGGISVTGIGRASISGGSVIGGSGTPNTATDGGGIYNTSFDGSAVILVGATVSFNTATNNGGGIWTDDGAVLMNSTIIESNRSDFDTDFAGNGAGIYNNSAIVNIISGTIIRSNAAGVSNGGGIFNTGTGTVSISGGVTIGGSGTGNQGVFGGGIYNESSSATAVTINGSSITFNTGGNAGGIYSTAGTITIQGTTITDNAVAFAGSGGGVNIQPGATLDIQLSSTIINNTSNATPDDCTGGGTFNTDASNTLGVGCPPS